MKVYVAEVSGTVIETMEHGWVHGVYTSPEKALKDFEEHCVCNEISESDYRAKYICIITEHEVE